MKESNSDEKFYYEGAGQEALDKWRKMTDAERQATKKGDDIDDINTTDIEKDDIDGSDAPFFNEVTFEYLEKNRINLARAFLGMDGGYSIRKLKKFLKQLRIDQ